MAKNNNKGFSLIEVVIAIAILTLLLTPIVNQFAQTLRVNRQAKEQQEANESAYFELEQFQKGDLDELKKKYAGKYHEHNSMPVKLWDVTTHTEIDTSSKPLTYTVYEFELDELKLGTKKTKYENKVFLDDLSNKVRDYGGESGAEHYKIAYGLDETTHEKFKDFELTNEGSIVKKDDDGFITDVVVTNGEYVKNPNEVNLGNVHNLDKNEVALVLGGTSNFDEQARKALFSFALAKLKEKSPENWKQVVGHSQGDSIFSAQAGGVKYIDLSETRQKRCIRVHCSKEVKGAQTEYVVKVDVYYEYPFTIDGEPFNEPIHFNVFSQRFKTDKCPEIYLEYQPFTVLTATGGNSLQYAANDYILIDNSVDESKLYLYKPKWDQSNAALLATDIDATKDEIFNQAYYETYDEKIDPKDPAPNKKSAELVKMLSTYYVTPAYTVSGSTLTPKKVQPSPVHIFIGSTNSYMHVLQLDDEGKVPDTSKEVKRMTVFTNMDITDFEKGTTTTAKWQFSVAGFSDFGYVGTVAEDGDGKNHSHYALGNSGGEYITKRPSAEDNDHKPVLMKLSDDTRESNRLYTITVQLTPDDKGSNTVKLTGAKGEN